MKNCLGTFCGVRGSFFIDYFIDGFENIPGIFVG